MKTSFNLISAVGILILTQSPVWAAARPLNSKPNFKKVLILVFENTNFEDAMKQSAFSALAKHGALLNQFYAEGHPSQPNYLAMISGDSHSVRTDNPVNLDGQQIGDLLNAKRISWKAYFEDYPGNCFKGDRHDNYVRKHNPFISFNEIQNSQDQCKHIVSAEQLKADINFNHIPDVSFYIPNLKNDGHDTGVSYANKWLEDKVIPHLGNSIFKDLLLVVTFDESGGSFHDNHVYTALYGGGVKPGSVSSTHYDHYSLLRTIEDRFQLGTIGQHDSKANPIAGIWG